MMTRETADYLERKLEAEKARRLQLWSDRLKAALEAGDAKAEAEARDHIWYIQNNY